MYFWHLNYEESRRAKSNVSAKDYHCSDYIGARRLSLHEEMGSLWYVPKCDDDFDEGTEPLFSLHAVQHCNRMYKCVGEVSSIGLCSQSFHNSQATS